MGILFSNPYHLALFIPLSVFLGFAAYVLIVAGPKFLKVFLKGGEIEVIYTPPKTYFIHQFIVEQPEKFKPIELNSNYFIGIIQPSPDEKNVYRIAVMEERQGEYVMMQRLYLFNGKYSTAKQLADLYAKNYGLSTRRLF